MSTATRFLGPNGDVPDATRTSVAAAVLSVIPAPDVNRAIAYFIYDIIRRTLSSSPIKGEWFSKRPAPTCPKRQYPQTSRKCRAYWREYIKGNAHQK